MSNFLIDVNGDTKSRFRAFKRHQYQFFSIPLLQLLIDTRMHYVWVPSIFCWWARAHFVIIYFRINAVCINNLSLHITKSWLNVFFVDFFLSHARTNILKMCNIQLPINYHRWILNKNILFVCYSARVLRNARLPVVFKLYCCLLILFCGYCLLMISWKKKYFQFFLKSKS